MLEISLSTESERTLYMEAIFHCLRRERITLQQACDDLQALIDQPPGASLTPDQSAAVATLIRYTVEQFLLSNETPSAVFSSIKFLLDDDRAEKLASYGT